MDKRKEKLLNLVIENYIENAEPIGSKFLVSSEDLKVSEATVRNELRALEEDGYLTHPHTSAGRIPTDKGYLFYIQSLDLEKTNASKRDSESFLECLKTEKEFELSRKCLAKTLVEISNETVILAFSLEKVYYTGLANLFNKPEFQELDLVANVSQVFDHCEDCLENFYDKVEERPKYFIGDEHPFGSALSVLSSKFGKDSLIALLGPKRMNYKYNFGLMKKIVEII